MDPLNPNSQPFLPPPNINRAVPETNSASEAEDFPLDLIFQHYQDADIPQLPDFWSAIAPQLQADATATPSGSISNEGNWFEAAALWVDTPYELSEQERTAFELALATHAPLQHHTAQLTQLQLALSQYQFNLYATLEKASLPKLDAAQLVRQALPHQAPRNLQSASFGPTGTVVTMDDVFPRWLTSAVAAVAVVVMVGTSPLSSLFNVTPNHATSATLAASAADVPSLASYTESYGQLPDDSGTLLATGAEAPTVEQYVMDSCSDTVPVSDWGVLTRCQF